MSSQTTRIVVFITGKENPKQNDCIISEICLDTDEPNSGQDSMYATSYQTRTIYLLTVIEKTKIQ